MLTLSQLEQYLSKAAWILKGPVDAADFKVYIFPLLFFKRISDVYDEEYNELSMTGATVNSSILAEYADLFIKAGYTLTTNYEEDFSFNTFSGYTCGLYA